MKKPLVSMPLWGKLLAGLLLTILVMFGAELFANRGYLALPEAERGVFTLTDAEITPYGYVPTEEGYVYTGEANQLRLDLGGRYVGKLSYTYDYEGLLECYVNYTWLNDFDSEEHYMLVDKNSAVIHTSVLNLHKRITLLDIYTDPTLLDEAGMEYLSLRELPLVIKEVQVINRFEWNVRRMLVFFLAGLCLTLFLTFKSFFAKKLEYAFLILAVSGGILMITCMPASKVSWDEELHFKNAYQLSLYPGGEMASTEFIKLFSCYIETWPLALPDSVEEKAEIDAYFNEMYENAPRTELLMGSTCSTATPGYLPPALFLKLGRKLHMPFTMLYQFGRLGGLLFYCLLMFFAIRIIPVGKKLLFMMGLMPTAMFLATCYSYDNVVISSISLGTAFMLREVLEEDRPFSWRGTALAAVFLVWGILPKAIYAPLVLIGLMIPAKKMKNKKLLWLVRAGVCLVFLLLMASFVLPRLFSPGDYGDIRGGAVDFGQQMHNILHKPFSYAKLLLQNIWQNLPSMLCGIAIFQLLGHWGTAGFTSVTLLFAFWVAMISSFGRNRISISLGKKLWILLMTVGCIALVWTAMYMSFTAPGAQVINGVQGRYFLPVFVLLGIMLQGKERIRISEENASLSLLLGSGFLLYSMVLITMIGQRCS